MALTTLGYEYDTIVSGDDTRLRVELPDATATFRFDPVTFCLEAGLLWRGRIPRSEATGALAPIDEDLLTVQGRIFLFAGVGVTWEQTAEFVHYALNEAAAVFSDTCTTKWPKAAVPARALVPPERAGVEFAFSDDEVAAGNPYGRLSDDTPAVTGERIHEHLSTRAVENLRMGAANPSSSRCGASG